MTPPESLSIFENLNVKENALLSAYTTFRLGGPCSLLIQCDTPEEVQQAVKALAQNKLPFILLGGGSNLVVSDQGLECIVIRYVSDTPRIEYHNDLITVSASTRLDDLALFAARRGLLGLNYTSGIPGSVGGAIVGNAGAFGQQVGDHLESVILLDRKGIQRKASPGELGFSYRDSKLKETGEIVLSASFRVEPGDAEKLLKEREETLNLRREKHPNLKTHPCAGSFFRNIEPTSRAGRRQATGWFLEQAGGKNLHVGGAKIFDRHANIIVKADETCRAQDVYELSLKMAELAKKAFDLDLIREVRFVGPFQKKVKDFSSAESFLIW
ncbi:MAG: UDP-N-acetylmuramate dehydrogenase [Candidatus Omnitrophica bacterium]|nr:UDP-N-acetylmuramate dehydrogenase [Candidatus Omnitrophota bacterium]